MRRLRLCRVVLCKLGSRLGRYLRCVGSLGTHGAFFGGTIQQWCGFSPRTCTPAFGCVRPTSGPTGSPLRPRLWSWRCGPGAFSWLTTRPIPWRRPRQRPTFPQVSSRRRARRSGSSSSPDMAERPLRIPATSTSPTGQPPISLRTTSCGRASRSKARSTTASAHWAGRQGGRSAPCSTSRTPRRSHSGARMSASRARARARRCRRRARSARPSGIWSSATATTR